MGDLETSWGDELKFYLENAAYEWIARQPVILSRQVFEFVGVGRGKDYSRIYYSTGQQCLGHLVLNFVGLDEIK